MIIYRLKNKFFFVIIFSIIWIYEKPLDGIVTEEIDWKINEWRDLR